MIKALLKRWRLPNKVAHDNLEWDELQGEGSDGETV